MSGERRIKITFNTRTHEFTKVEGGDYGDPMTPGDGELHQRIDDVVAALGGGKSSDSKPVEKQTRHVLTRQRATHKRQ